MRPPLDMELSFSIVTPSLNQQGFIEETIQSVISQDCANLEYIIVDGGSTDGTLEVLLRYEKELKWMSEPDRGQSHAINKGFQMARGSVLAWLNADDTYLPGALKKVAEYLDQHPDVMMVYGEGYLIDENSRVVGSFPATEPFNLWRLIYYQDYILQQTVFVRREVFDQIGLLDEDLHYGMDWDLWIRIGKHFKVAYMPDHLANLREHASAKTSAGGIKRFRELVRIMRRHGTRRFPPAYLRYGWDAYLRSFVELLGVSIPWLRWHWVYRIGNFGRRMLFHLLFRQMSKMAYPSQYSDCWVSDNTDFFLLNDSTKSYLFLSGNTHAVPEDVFPLQIKVLVNGRLLEKRTLKGRSRFELQPAIPLDLRPLPHLEVGLRANKHFMSSRDSARRRLAFQIDDIQLVKA